MAGCDAPVAHKALPVTRRSAPGAACRRSIRCGSVVTKQGRRGGGRERSLGALRTQSQPFHEAAECGDRRPDQAFGMIVEPDRGWAGKGGGRRPNPPCRPPSTLAGHDLLPMLPGS